MADRNGWPIWSNKDGIKSMDTNHIKNTIALIKRNWEKYPDRNEHLTADHWSLPQVVFEPGKPWFKDRLAELREELNRRSAPTVIKEEENK